MSAVSLLRAGALADVRNGEVLRDQVIEIADGVITGVDSWSQEKHGKLPHHDLREHLVTPSCLTCTRTCRASRIRARYRYRFGRS